MLGRTRGVEGMVVALFGNVRECQMTTIYSGKTMYMTLRPQSDWRCSGCQKGQGSKRMRINSALAPPLSNTLLSCPPNDRLNHPLVLTRIIHFIPSPPIFFSLPLLSPSPFCSPTRPITPPPSSRATALPKSFGILYTPIIRTKRISFSVSKFYIYRYLLLALSMYTKIHRPSRAPVTKYTYTRPFSIIQKSKNIYKYVYEKKKINKKEEERKGKTLETTGVEENPPEADTLFVFPSVG